MIDHRGDALVKKLFQLAFGKRPAEELYDLQEDPGQLNNVVDLPEYTERKRKLVAIFEREFTARYDPAALGIPPRPASTRND
jgi:N-sulfoglucosamine sulfohydrolase